MPNAGDSEAETEAEKERRLFILLALASSAKEAADAFRSCDAEGGFAIVERSTSFAQLKDNIAFLRRSLDKSDPESFYCRVLRTIRDGTGWHWKRDLIEGSLEASAHFEVNAFSDPDVADATSIPMVRALVSHAALISRFDSGDLRRLVSDLLELQFHLQAVSHDLYFLHVNLVTDLPGDA